MDDSAWFMAEEVILTMKCTLHVSMQFAECAAPRLKCVVLTHPWIKLAIGVRVGPNMATVVGKQQHPSTTTPLLK